MKRKQKWLIPLLAVMAGLSMVAIAGLLLFHPFRPDRWEITQYGSDDGSQHMFYTITDQNGRLAVIDGGWESDADEVEEVIRSLGGHVDVWVITHPHPDHVGALNRILADYSKGTISIDRIYTVPVREERYRETAKDYDDYPSYEAFRTHCANLGDIVTYVKENDTVDLIGLRMKVLSAWDERIDLFENNECNNGSMMFKVSGKKDSMLFCADVQKEMEYWIIPDHGDELDSDYVQLGHHGNWGLTTDFYDLVAPKGAFFDAPSSIIDNTDASYDGWKLRDYLLNRGVTLYRYAEAPNTIILT